MNISCIAIDVVGESFQCRLTTDHSASSYGIPVIIIGDDRLLDYGDVATLWLIRDMDTERHVDFETHARLDAILSPYGIEVRCWVG